jgi:hypothetical protein
MKEPLFLTNKIQDILGIGGAESANSTLEFLGYRFEIDKFFELAVLFEEFQKEDSNGENFYLFVESQHNSSYIKRTIKDLNDQFGLIQT